MGIPSVAVRFVGFRRMSIRVVSAVTNRSTLMDLMDSQTQSVDIDPLGEATRARAEIKMTGAQLMDLIDERNAALAANEAIRTAIWDACWKGTELPVRDNCRLCRSPGPDLGQPHYGDCIGSFAGPKRGT